MIVLVILWTCVGVFVASAVIAILALLGRVKIGRRYQAALFTGLILEIVAVGVGVFSGKIDPVHLENKIRNAGETEAYQKLSQEMQTVTNRIQQNFNEGHFDEGASDLAMLFDQTLGNKLAPTAEVFYLKGVLSERRLLWADAATNYEIALQIRPTYLDAMIRAGSAMTQIQEYEAAQVLYNSADQIARNLADESTTYRIANGRQNLERRYGAFLLEVGRKEAADEHFQKALMIISSMEALTPPNKDITKERNARYRTFWEWRRYDEATAEVRALAEESGEVSYQEDLAAILLEKSDTLSLQEALSILERLKAEGKASGFAIASLAEASGLVKIANDQRADVLNLLSRTIVAERSAEPDPYLYYAKAVLCRSMGRKDDATIALDEAINRERFRQRNVYTFDPVRLEKYQVLRAAWDAVDKREPLTQTDLDG